MLLSRIKVGDLLLMNCIERGVMTPRPILVLNIIPIPNKHGGPNVSILDRGVEYQVRNTQVWPIEARRQPGCADPPGSGLPGADRSKKMIGR